MASVRKRVWKSGSIEHAAWVCDYKDQHGKRRHKTFPTKKAADGWAVTALHEVSQGTHTAASTSVTVIEAWERWVADGEASGLEFGTLQQQRQHLALHVAPFTGREKLSSLTMPRIHQFDTELRKAGRSLSMRRKVLTSFKTMLTYSQGQGLVSQNVARGIKLKKDDRAAPGPLREGVDFPSRSEIKTLIEAAPDRWRPFLVTAIFTGMRASELRGLSWDDVDLDAGVIHVRRRADAWGRIGPPKSKAGKRDIPLAPLAVNTLKQWQSRCPPGNLELVFPTSRGNVQMLSNISKRFWHPLQLACGMTAAGTRARYGFHRVRHAAASLFIAYLGWTPKRLQTVMGHSSIKMTFDLYGHLFEDTAKDREAMEKIEAAITAA